MVDNVRIVVGVDSYMFILGVFGVFVVGIGVMDIVVVMGFGKIWFCVFESVLVVFEGRFGKNVMVVDVMIYIIIVLRDFEMNYKVIEFFNVFFSFDERLIFINFSVEVNVKIGIIGEEYSGDGYVLEFGIDFLFFLLMVVKLYYFLNGVFVEEVEGMKID